MKSDLFIECAKNVVDFYNLTQETVGSKKRMEYPVVKEAKPREWTLGIGFNDEVTQILWENAPYGDFPCNTKYTIKVREVIE